MILPYMYSLYVIEYLVDGNTQKYKFITRES